MIEDIKIFEGIIEDAQSIVEKLRDKYPNRNITTDTVILSEMLVALMMYIEENTKIIATLNRR